MKINIKIWQVPVFIFSAIFLLLISFNFTQACKQDGESCSQNSSCCASDCQADIYTGGQSCVGSADPCNVDLNDGDACTYNGVTGKCNNIFQCKPVTSTTLAGAATTTNVTTPPFTTNTTGSGSGGSCTDPKYEKVGGVCLPKDTGLSSAPITTILFNLFNWLFTIFLLLGVVAFMISGIQYLTSGGNEDMLKTAKRNMTWSIVGVIVGLSGRVIIEAVAKALTGYSSTF